MSATILLILRLALTTTLYIFLGLALWILWQDLRQHSTTWASKQAPALILRAVISTQAEISTLTVIRTAELSGGEAVIATETAPSTEVAPSTQAASSAAIYRFTSSEVFIGRDPASECRLDDKTISARHARLAYHHGQWWVEDLQSRNGTSLNGVPVSTPVVLTSGDQLQCGACTFSVILGEDAQPES